MKKSDSLSLRVLAVISLLVACFGLAMMEATALADQVIQNTPARQSANLIGGQKQGDNSLLLEPDRPIEREIAVNETHSYRIALVAGQYLNVIVDQRETDVQIRWFAPDGQVLGILQRYVTAVPTPVSLLAAATGEHRIEVTSVNVPLSKNRGPKIYQIRISELRPSTPEDVSRLSARSLYLEGINLLLKGPPESRKEALAKFEEGLRRLRVAGDRRGEAYALTDLSGILRTPEPQKALDYSLQAALLWRELGETYAQSYSLMRNGEIYRVLGLLDKELESYTEALALSRTFGDRSTELTALNTLYNFYSRVGDKEKAAQIKVERDPLGRAFEEDRRTTVNADRVVALKKIEEARKFINLGTSQSLQSGLELYEAALQLYRTAGDRGGEAETLVSLGRVAALMGDKNKAFDFLDQAIRAAKASNRSPIETLNSLQNLRSVAKAYEDLGEKFKAIDVYSSMFEPLKMDVSSTIDLHLNISRIHDSVGDRPKALEHLNNSLRLLESEPSFAESRKAEVLGRIAKIESDGGNLVEARRQIEAALVIIEQRRDKIVSQDLRASYFASSQSYYEFYIDLLMRLDKAHPSEGYAIKAMQASERSRARSLNEVLVEAHASIHNGIDPVLIDRRKKLQEQLNAAAGGNTSNLNKTPDQREKLWELTTAYHQVEALIRQSNPRYAALTQPIPLTLAQIQQLLEADTVLLEYSLGAERSYLWLITPTSFASYQLPAQSKIADEAKLVLALFNDGKQWATNNQMGSKYLSVATRLSQLLFPESAQGSFGKRLLIVPDGALQYLAFGALPNLKKKDRRVIDAGPLLADYEIVTIPSVSTLAVLRSESQKRSAPNKSVVVLADPVFDPDDERVRQSRRSSLSPQEVERPVNANTGPMTELQRSIREVLSTDTSSNVKTRIPRLPFSREEANAIFTTAPSGEAIKSVDFEANRAIATGQAVAQARIVHFATHGLLNSEHPELSGIILSLVNENGEPIDGFFRLHEIYNLSLRADLVVLSACQTGLGKEIRGEGLVGLTRGFMYTGAPRVVASLWKVDDVATAELMKIFYWKMLRERMPVATALREAQLQMWRTKRWSQPYYWAAFQLQGEWK